MKISGLSCITKKIFLVFLGHPSLHCLHVDMGDEGAQGAEGDGQKR